MCFLRSSFYCEVLFSKGLCDAVGPTQAKCEHKTPDYHEIHLGKSKPLGATADATS